MDMTRGLAARDALRAHEARTRRGAWALLLGVGALTAGAVWTKIGVLGVAALLLLFGGALWLARRHLRAQEMRFRAGMW